VRLVKVLALAVVLALVADVAFLSDDILLARILPFANLIIVGNWVPLLVSFLAGLAWSLIPRQAIEAAPQSSPPAESDSVNNRSLPAHAGAPSRWPSLTVQLRRVVVVLLLEAIGWYAVVRPLWGAPPQCRDWWENDYCLQTTDDTGMPACAATLLKAHGIEATEQEMANLSLTRSGTRWQGLYRGLKLKTAHTPWDVQIVNGSFDRLRSLGDAPAILAAGIPRSGRVARMFTERYGWTPGEWNPVLFFGFRGDGRVAIGDPSPGVGKQDWTEDDLRVLWRGRGMRLVPRPR
jgi:hypothetical protein